MIPPGQYLLEKSGVVERSGQVSAAPIRQQQLSIPRTARLGDRLIAAALDNLVILSAAVLIGAWSFKRWSFYNQVGFHVTSASLIIALTLSVAILFLYFWLLEAAFGATLGKVLIGIRIAHTPAHNSITASLIRNALRVLDGIGFYVVGAIVAGCSQLRQRVGDILADTIVVEESFGPGAKSIALVLWLALLSGTVWALPRVWSATNSTQPPQYLSGSVAHLGYTTNSVYVSASGLRLELHRDSVPGQDVVTSVDESVQ